jgi:hypothetical protein
MILDYDRAHTSALCEPGQIDGINASWDRIGGHMNMDVDDAVERWGFSVGIP